MSYFGKFYLDKEKDIVVKIYKEDHMSYEIYTENHKSDNLINNLAKIFNKQIAIKNNKKVITGTIPAYIKGNGEKLYIFRINGTKIANIYLDGRIDVNSFIPAIAKTLMSQTKEYKFSFRETLIKSYVKEEVKLQTDLHTHGNANLSATILIALAIKHQISYPYYYIKKLKLKLSNKQYEYLEKEREKVIPTLDLSGLDKKHRERKIDDYTYINFADLILNNIEEASENIRKIEVSLSILKESQAVFTNLEKLYLYRYVFTKGKIAPYLIELNHIEKLEDYTIKNYLHKMLEDTYNADYQNNNLYEDTLLWIGREYARRGIRYVEISDTTLVKKEDSNIRMLSSIHKILPLVKEETEVDIRFLAAIRRIPLTLVKDNIASVNYLTEAMETLKIVCKDPYVVGSDFVGEEISDIEELKEVIKEIVSTIAYEDPNWTIRIHAGENDALRNNMAKAIQFVEDSLKEGQPFPSVRIGHGVYCANLKGVKGQVLLDKIKKYNIVLEFQFTSNVRLNNITDIKKHPLKIYLNKNINCVMGTDGCGLYGTDNIDEQLTLENFLKVSEEEFLRMKEVENAIINKDKMNFIKKKEAMNLNNNSIESYYHNLFSKEEHQQKVNFIINKKSSYLELKEHIKELPWDLYPIIIAGGSFNSTPIRMSDKDKVLLDTLLNTLDKEKVFFIIGHKISAHERYLLENNKGFKIFSIVPSLMSTKQIQKIKKADLEGVRISTESAEMGIYKSFNYEVFERRNSILFAFDGNSALTNLIQEANNGKGKTYIFIQSTSKTIMAKAKSLQGYVTMNASMNTMLKKVDLLIEDIGEKLV